MRKSLISKLFFISWLLYFGKVFWNLISFDSQGNLLIHHPFVWADWAAHFTMGSAFAYRSLVITESPFLINSTFSYPFAINWLTALLIKVGIPFFSSFVVLSFVLCLATVGSLFLLYLRFFRSRAVAILSSCIFLLNGGWGAFSAWQSWQNGAQWFTNQPDTGIRYINIIHSMLLPQRAITLGLSWGLLILWSAHAVIFNAGKDAQLRRSAVIGIGWGLLPLIHTHTFVAVSGILTSWILSQCFFRSRATSKLYWQKNWAVVLGLATLVATPILYYFFYGRAQSFIQWQPGWLAPEEQLNWITFWWLNWGITLPLALWSVIKIAKSKIATKLQTLSTVLPFIALFIVANLFIFQPWAWDNTKLFVWASVGISGLAGWGIWQIARLQTTLKPLKLLLPAVAVILFLVSIASGGLDALQLIRNDRPGYVMYTSEELALAEWVKANTSADSTWATETNHNNWLYNLTGRQAVMTYPGWLWSQGYEYYAVEYDLQQMLQLNASSQLYEEYDIDYIAVKKPVAQPESSFLHLLYDSSSYMIYEVQ
ncbi:MAG: hypothetical protein M3Q81_05165 [bacterium]|nr:hypothetical protein [bacterium]